MQYVDVQTLVKRINADAAHKFVLTITGGGFQALGDLGAMGGLSNTLLAAYQPYHPTSQEMLLNFKPEKSCSAETAMELAMFSYMRARKIAPEEKVIGIGCTSSLALAEGQEERVGRQHKIYLGIQTHLGESVLWSLHLSSGKRNRILEENINRVMILNAIAYGSNLDCYLQTPLLELEEVIAEREAEADLAGFNFCKGSIIEVLDGKIPYAICVPNKDSIYKDNVVDKEMALLSGSFNPVHDAHRKMRDIGAEVLGREVFYEMPIFNADKPPANYFTIKKRLEKFKNQPYPVVISNAGTFVDKAKIYHGAKFLVGVDTAKRICDPRFYHNSKGMMLDAFEELRIGECKFVVFGRVNDHSEFVDFTNEQDNYPCEFRQLCIPVAEKDFRNDISSTKIREGGEHASS